MVLGELVWPYLRERRQRGELSVKAVANYTTALNGFADSYGRRSVKRLSPADVERWLETIGHLSPGTRRGQFSSVRAFCRWLVERGHVKRDPTYSLKAPKKPRSVPRALPFDSVVATLESAPDQRARLILTLMVQQGLRCKEVVGLELGDLDFTNGMMRVVGKGDHERLLPITADTSRELRCYLGEYPATNGPLIRSYSHPNRGLSANYVSKLGARYTYGAGVKAKSRDGVGAHAFRHTAATDMLRGGAHLRDVQQALGHQHLSTTEIYLPHLVGTLKVAMGGRSYDALPEPATLSDAMRAVDSELGRHIAQQGV